MEKHRELSFAMRSHPVEDCIPEILVYAGPESWVDLGRFCILISASKHVAVLYLRWKAEADEKEGSRGSQTISHLQG